MYIYSYIFGKIFKTSKKSSDPDRTCRVAFLTRDAKLYVSTILNSYLHNTQVGV